MTTNDITTTNTIDGTTPSHYQQLVEARNRILELEKALSDANEGLDNAERIGQGQTRQIESLTRQIEVLQRETREVPALTRQVEALHREVAEARSLHGARKVALRHLLASKHGIPSRDIDMTEVDDSALWDRLMDLVEDDDDERWVLEQDFDVTVTLTVTIRGTLRATSQEEADKLAEEAAGAIHLTHRADQLPDSELSDVSVDSVEADR